MLRESHIVREDIEDRQDMPDEPDSKSHENIRTCCLRCKDSFFGNRMADLTGRQFGMWTVTKFHGSDPISRVRLWKCHCVCGYKTVRSTGYLNDITIGGCRKCRAKRQLRFAEVGMWMSLRAGAKSRGIKFNLDRVKTFDLLRKQKYRCALTGLPLIMALGRRDYQHGGSTAFLDRIDSSKGYVRSNIWWVHKDVNRMKAAFKLSRFLEICHLVAKKKTKGMPCAQ